jgi:hypothetical protein
MASLLVACLHKLRSRKEVNNLYSTSDECITELLQSTTRKRIHNLL